MKIPPYYGEEDDGANMMDEVYFSTAGTDVVIYNYDLSEKKEIRAVISNRTQDTKLNALHRHIFCPIGSIKAGMYVYYKGRYWICNSIVDDNGVYEKGVISICNVCVDWLDDDGKPHQRHAYAINATQYNNGETAAKYYFLRTDQLLLMLPNDEETCMLKTGKRFILDARIRFYEKDISDETQKDTSFPVLTYRLTRMDSVLYDYTDSGVVQCMVTQDEQGADDGFYRVGGKKYWLCGQPTNEDLHPHESQITYDEDVVYISGGESIFTSLLMEDDGVEDFVTPASWTIDAEFIDSLIINADEHSISIATNDPKLAGKKFTLIMSADSYQDQSLEIRIKRLL